MISFDVIETPSRGYFYKNRNSTILTVQSLSAKEEYILTSPTLAGTRSAVNMVLESVLLDNDITVDELLIADRDAVLIYLRSSSFGDNIDIDMTCPHCNSNYETAFPLSKLTINESKILPDTNGQYSYVLSGVKWMKGEDIIIKFRPLLVKDENKIFESGAEIISGTIRVKAMTVSINDVEDRNFIDSVISNMPIKDFTLLKNYMKEVEPGINEEIVFACEICGEEFIRSFVMGVELLNFPLQYRDIIRNEIFMVQYYGEGGFSREDMFNMSAHDRRWNLSRISEERDKIREAEEKAATDARNKK